MAQKQKGFVQLLVLFAIVMYIVLGIITPIVNRRLSPSEAFKKFVCRPIPKSVTEIKMGRLIRWTGWHRYVFHFKIDEEDLLPILDSWPFQELKYFKYSPEYNGLEWAKEEPPDYSQSLNPPPWESSSMQLYNIRSGESKPEWFNLEQWDSPKVYVYDVRIDARRLRLLVYNKKLGEAYFIDYRTSGH
jgi:hypothetical protein